MSIAKEFRIARNAGVPIIAIETADPYATITELTDASPQDTPCISWDVARGLVPMNEPGKKALETMDIASRAAEMTNIPEFLNMTIRQAKLGLPPNSIVFMHSSDRFWDEFQSMQAIYNCRNPFKMNMRTLVLIASNTKLGPELSSDVLVLSEPLPDDKALTEIITGTYKGAKDGNPDIPELTDEHVGKAVAALAGLSSFSAEQVVAMGIKKTGLDQSSLWNMKRTQIEQTPGLSVDKDTMGFADIGGCDNIKKFLLQFVKGKWPPRCIVRLDEIEKMLAGAGGDSSGTSQDQLGQILSFMQDKNIPGLIAFGPPGSGKSAISKAIGKEAGVPTISMDLGSMKGSLVGSSEQRVRTALKVIMAISQGNALFIGTANKLATLPPELRRRFKLGIWLHDLPTDEEREMIWEVCLKKHKLTMGKGIVAAAFDAGWTGAEIDSCCEISWRLGCSLTEAAEYIVPVSRSASVEIERLREEANGKFLSASYPGIYRKEGASEFATMATATRQIRDLQ